MSQTPPTPPGTAGQIVLGAIELSGLLERVENGDATQTEAAAMHDLWCAFKSMIRDYNADVEKALLGQIERSGDIELGNGRRLYAAPNKTTKCIDRKQTLEEVIEACEGDMDAVLGCLISQPFKPGESKKMIGPHRVDDCFETVVTSKTKEGVSKLKPQIADDSRKGK